MIKLFIAILAIFAVGTFSAFEINNKPLESSESAISVESEVISEISMEEESSSSYDAYMEELNAVGPKEFVGANEKTESTDHRISIDNIGEENVTPELLDKTIVASPVKEIEEAQENELLVVVDHAPFGKLLQKHVTSQGKVNYEAFKKDQSLLEAYIVTLQTNPVDSKMSKNERLSYWINVYNAFTIKLILDNYPVKSIKDINGGKPWDKVFIKLGNTSYSLNDVENNIIRTRFTEPRIHFAVNCAATSCPPLLNDAYYPDQLLAQLAERSQSFITNQKYNTITETTLQVSKIFDWYGSDFKDVKSFIQKYVKVDVSNTPLTFKEYDWSLNKQ